MPRISGIELRRSGLLSVRVAGDHHCGTKSSVSRDGTVSVRYELVITASATALDSFGFLQDQERLHRALETFASEPLPWRESCELLALLWGKQLLTLMSEWNPGCDVLTMSLSLSPFPHGGTLTARWG